MPQLADVPGGRRVAGPRDRNPGLQPGGLDFSPALTLRFIKHGHGVRWIDTPYHEREGQSKLTLLGDGLRFLKATLFTS